MDLLPEQAKGLSREYSGGQKQEQLFLRKIAKKRVFSPHRSENGRTDGFLRARNGSCPARTAKMAARNGFSSHGRENGRTK
jgi:hypothetical protein